MFGFTQRSTIIVTVGLLLATAVFLMIVRGEALLLDMSTLIGALCL
jgi:hypothetical protein